MLVVYLMACGLGALTTFVVLLPYSWLIALLGAPFGGSALTLVVAVGFSVGASLRTFKGGSLQRPLGITDA